MTLLLIGLVVPYLWLGVTQLETADEGYQLMCVRNYRWCPLAMLSFFQGHLWMAVFGDTGLSMRMCAVFAYQMAIGMGCLWLWWRRRSTLEALFWWAVCMTAVRTCGFFIYNWDVGAYPYVALWIVLMLSWCHQPRTWKAAALGAACALVAMSHVSFIVYTLYGATLVACKRKWGRELLWFGAAFIVMFAAVSTLMSGTPWAYIATFNAENIITGHSQWQIICNTKSLLMNEFPGLFRWYILVILCFGAIYFGSRVKRYSMGWIVAALACCATVGCLGLCNIPHAQEVWGVPIMTLLILLGWLPVRKYTTDRALRVPWLQIVIILWGVVSLGVGSDNWIYRPSGGLFAIPIAVAVLAPCFGKYDLRRLQLFGLGLFVMAVALGVTKVVNMRENYPLTMDYPHYQGLMGRGEVAYYMNSQRRVVEAIRRQGLNVGVGGYNDKYYINYVWDIPTEPRLLQEFHFGLDDDALAYYAGLMERYDVICIVEAIGERANGYYKRLYPLLLEAGYRRAYTIPEFQAPEGFVRITPIAITFYSRQALQLRKD